MKFKITITTKVNGKQLVSLKVNNPYTIQVDKIFQNFRSKEYQEIDRWESLDEKGEYDYGLMQSRDEALKAIDLYLGDRNIETTIEYIEKS